jgi:hypothetical protein
MAAFALLGLSIALGVVALAGLRPWATTSVVPNLSVAPGIGVALGDAAVVARAGSPGAGTGGVAAPGPAGTVSAPVAVATPAPEPRISQPVLAVSPGRPLTVSAPAPVASPPPSEPAAPAPAPVAVTPVPAAEQAPPQPVVATVGNGGPGSPSSPGRPVASGVDGPEPEQACEGDEYVITVTFEEGGDGTGDVDYELAEADILVQRLVAGGNETEAELRGDLSDVRSLVAALVAEGNCVQVDVVPVAAGPVGEEPEAGGDIVDPGEMPEPALP